jgi:hypothetical protein
MKYHYFSFGNPKSSTFNIYEFPHTPFPKLENFCFNGSIGDASSMVAMAPKVALETHGIRDLGFNRSTWATTPRPLVDEFV